MAVNDGPQHVVAHAALVALHRWVTDGVHPPEAPPLALASASPVTIARDELGNARGGVRTPAVDVPVAALSGARRPGSEPDVRAVRDHRRLRRAHAGAPLR